MKKKISVALMAAGLGFGVVAQEAMAVNVNATRFSGFENSGRLAGRGLGIIGGGALAPVGALAGTVAGGLSGALGGAFLGGAFGLLQPIGTRAAIGALPGSVISGLIGGAVLV